MFESSDPDQGSQHATCKESKMADTFPVFAKMVAKSFQDIVKEANAFVVDVEGDTLYERYLAAFPEGTNPIFRKNTEHDCSCCKQFIRRVGGVVAIRDGGIHTIWGEAANSAPAPYNVVAAALRDTVKGASIRDLFRVSLNEGSFGAAQTRSLDAETQKVVTWNHFYTGEIPRNYRVASPDQVRGDYRTTVQVFERGLVELTPDAVETVLGLVTANNLYRGEEHKPALVQFQKMQREYLAKSGRERNLFAWANAGNPAARFRNTVIGTLVQDLSEGKDLEHSVKSFETKVAPTNYKRTTALITPGMIKKAMEVIESLGLEPALERRFATIADISVNDVKWVDGAVKPLMKGGIGDVLMKHASAMNKTPTKDEERAEDISLDDFMSKVLPATTSLDLLFKNELIGNLVSLTAPVHPEPKQLFKWSNDFAWSYGGNVADSIKERVKRAGGKVDGAAMRVSLSWFNFDDLDLHIYEPKGTLIFFGNRRGLTGGTLDVDMNAGHGTTREPVENIVWSVKPADGVYRVVVNNYTHREASNPGFVVETENGGKLTHFTYNKALRTSQSIEVARLHVKNGVVEEIRVLDDAITTGAIAQDKWGLKTEQYVKVSAVTLSPNYWGNNAVGNKHTFFVVDGAKNDEPTRGFYNEFLHPRLEPHRKVFEVIGDKTKCQPADAQLSGLGFSSTKKESFIVRALQGKKQRVFHIHVGV
jgi:hypothetical protein